MSQIAADYGLDVWIWYPAMDRDYCDSQTVERALAEWAEIFKKLPRITPCSYPAATLVTPLAPHGAAGKRDRQLQADFTRMPRCGFHPRASPRPGSTSS